MATSVITPPIYATGDFIEASWANDLRSNFLVLDDRTGEDPGASGRIPVSSSSLAAVWTAHLTAIQTAVGGTPVIDAGDTMTGNLGFVGNNIGVVFGGNGQLRDQTTGTQETQLFGNGDRVVVYRESGANAMLTITNTLATFVAAISATAATLTGTLTGVAANFSGALTAASAAITGAITGASLTTSGGISTSGGSIGAPAGSVTAGVNMTASGTINGGTDVQKAGVSLARIVNGSFFGNGGSARQITTSGFVPKEVLLTWTDGGTLHKAFISSATPGLNMIIAGTASPSASPCVATNLHATNGFVVDDADGTNTSGPQYFWTAWG